MTETRDCAVLFLAGGQSRRMGQPKAWLPFGGRPLLVHLVERMRARFPEVLVVAAPDQDLPDVNARIVRDERPGEGPVAGLAVGLRETRQSFAFAASCDAPFLDPDVAAHLLERCREADVAVPEWEGRLHPLHAVYRASVQPLLEAQLEAGRRRPVDLFDRVRTVVVGEEELRALDPEGRTFRNMNTPEEYAQALLEWDRWTLRP